LASILKLEILNAWNGAKLGDTILLPPKTAITCKTIPATVKKKNKIKPKNSYPTG